MQTTIASENPGKRVTVSLKEAEEADRIVRAHPGAQSKPWTVSVGLSSTGSRANRRDRLTVAGTPATCSIWITSSRGRTHVAGAALGDVRQFRGTYSVPLYRLGGVLAGTALDSGGATSGLPSAGAGQTMGLNYSPLPGARGGLPGAGGGGLDDKRFDAAQVGGVVPPGQLTRRRAAEPGTAGQAGERDNASLGYEVDCR